MGNVFEGVMLVHGQSELLQFSTLVCIALIWLILYIEDILRSVFGSVL